MIVVIKVGGSLLDWPLLPDRLSQCLRLFDGAKVAMIVGGGQAADLVRSFDQTHGLGETRAHALALDSLTLTSRLMAMLIPDCEVVETLAEIERVWSRQKLPIFAPGVFMMSVDPNLADPLPKTWQTTTDSIAARVARTIAADRLVLLKSDSLPTDQTREQAALAGYVDSNFPRASRSFSTIGVINLRAEPLQIERLL